MKKALLIQSRKHADTIKAERAAYERAIGGWAQAEFASSLDQGLPWHCPEELMGDADVVFVCGSGEYSIDGGLSLDDPIRKDSLSIEARLSPLIHHLVAHDIPTLGICFGHQVIGNIMGGDVRNDTRQKKVGTYDVALNETGTEDALFGRLPARFAAQYGHKDSLTIKPSNAKALATGEKCGFAALRYGKNVYTTQFHPELTKTDVVWRLRNTPGYLLEGGEPEDVVRESPHASSLISLFLQTAI